MCHSLHNLILKALFTQFSVTTGWPGILPSASTKHGAELVVGILQLCLISHSPHSCTVISLVQTELLDTKKAVWQSLSTSATKVWKQTSPRRCQNWKASIRAFLLHNKGDCFSRLGDAFSPAFFHLSFPTFDSYWRTSILIITHSLSTPTSLLCMACHICYPLASFNSFFFPPGILGFIWTLRGFFCNLFKFLAVVCQQLWS